MRPDLSQAEWLTSAPSRAVMAALQTAGGADCARFVGGCVRNALLDQPVDDIDIATRLTPDRTLAALQAAGLKAIPTGIDHGTVTAVADGRPYEITTLRRDVETDGRRAVVAFTTDWAEDAARRDFGVNALYADAAGGLHDPTGRGLSDLAAGRIAFVGDAHMRIREDYLRILRFFRFHAWYGSGPLDAGGLAACRDLAGGLSRLSAERVSKELLKLLSAPDPRPSVRAMREAGVLRAILPEAEDAGLFEAMVDLSADPLLRLSAMLPVDAEGVDGVARRLRLSNAQRGRLVAMTGSIAPDISERAARAALYRLGREVFSDRLMRGRAERPDADPAAIETLVDTWTPPPLPIGGREIAALGVAPGPHTGQLLRAFEEDWIAADFPTEGHQERLSRLHAASVL
ncbi:CCA tRNA nucleotidyltransferase [Brevundimonas sp. S30B]|uniref:CCA tRNA nucleotidyltransferase n=1 Tax=unclassified Brevundimonas TaxID=2622653 RepID=UPI001072BEA8|nr:MULTISPECIES: CCA tRNA nucleotidyltransferase [unclassified Brevundimonas]QBX38604.1 CCA tRNA nucleotidyltransferase [Brevundimonas sp. MF30-B]TFW01195.1 CCA tRNA nucleotidyltransferase [Brevundimonas sp. S30B]